MFLTLQQGYPDRVGRRYLFSGSGNGPSSSSPAVGDPLNIGQFNNYIDAAFAAVSVSGNYEVKFFPSNTGGRATWNAFYFLSGKQGVATVVQNVAGSGMTPGTVVPLVFSGGGGTGAAGTLTVLTATTFSIQLTNRGGGYTSAPTVTVSGTGGTPPTLTATAASGSGAVANGTDLSLEQFQVSGFGGVY